MSLKHFHLVFIILSTLVILWYGLWELSMIESSSSAGHITMAVVSLFITLGLIYYTILVIQKFRRLAL